MRRIGSLLVSIGLLVTMVSMDQAGATWPTAWSGGGVGTTTVVSDGTASDPEFSYHHQPSYSGDWQFSTVANATGPVSMDYLYAGYHAFYQAKAYLRTFVTHAGTTTRTVLVDNVPASGGFRYLGTTSVNVETGDTYGFDFGGSNFDSDSRLFGTLAIGKPGLNLVLAPDARTAAGEPTTVTATASLSPTQAASFVPLVLTMDLPAGLTLTDDPIASGWDCTASTETRISCTSTSGGARVAPGTTLPAIPLRLISSTRAEYPIGADFTGSWAHNTTASATVGFGNRAPVAVDDTAATPKGTPLTLSMTGNDTDADGDTLTVTSTTPAASGTVSCSAGSCTYTPNPDFVGSDAFTYTISDGNVGTATAQAVITVTPPDVPAAAGDTVSTPEDTPISVPVTANDVLGNKPATISLDSGPAHGSATCATVACSYSPAANYTGTDSFTYTLRDADGQTSTATVAVTVTPVNDPPVLSTPPAEGSVGSPLAPLSGTDPDGDTLTYRVVDGSLPSGVTLNPDGTFGGSPTAAGVYSARIAACDPTGVCDEKEVRLTIAGTTLTVAGTPPPVGLPAPLETLPRTAGHAGALAGFAISLLATGLLLRLPRGVSRVSIGRRGSRGRRGTPQRGS